MLRYVIIMFNIYTLPFTAGRSKQFTRYKLHVCIHNGRLPTDMLKMIRRTRLRKQSPTYYALFIHFHVSFGLDAYNRVRRVIIIIIHVIRVVYSNNNNTYLTTCSRSFLFSPKCFVNGNKSAARYYVLSDPLR